MDLEREPPTACRLGTYAPSRKTMTPELLQDVLDKHSRWVKGLAGGVCANLSLANLEGLDLSKVDLRWAKLGSAKLARAHLAGARLTGADMFCVDLRNCDLRQADLSGTDLRGARLHSADCTGAYLRGADLREGTLIAPADGSPLNLATMPRIPRLNAIPMPCRPGMERDGVPADPPADRRMPADGRMAAGSVPAPT